MQCKETTSTKLLTVNVDFPTTLCLMLAQAKGRMRKAQEAGDDTQLIVSMSNSTVGYCERNRIRNHLAMCAGLNLAKPLVQASVNLCMPRRPLQSSRAAHERFGHVDLSFKSARGEL